MTEGWTEERRRPVIPTGSGCSDKSLGSGVEHTQDDDAEDASVLSLLSLLFIVSDSAVEVDDNELTGLDVIGTTTETNEDDPVEEADTSVSSSVVGIVGANWSVDVGDSKHCASFVVAPAAAAAVVWRLSEAAAATKPAFRKTSRLMGSVGSRTRAKPSWLRRLRKEDIFRIPNNS